MIVLANRRFCLLWSGQLLSGLGGWLLVLAVPFFVFRLTGSTLWSSLAFVAETAPAVVLGPFGGALADRWDRRTAMIGADLARAAVLLPLLLVHDRRTVWVVLAVLVAESAATQLFQPAHRALVVEAVGRGRDLDAANSWYAVAAGVVRVVGGPLGGALYGLLSFRGLVVIDAATYAVSALALLLMGRSRTAGRDPVGPDGNPAATPAGVLDEVLAGLRFLWRHPTLRVLLVVESLFVGANGALNVLLVPFLVTHLHLDARGVGLALAALGVGYLLGGPLGRTLARSERLPSMLGGLLVGVAFACAALFDAGSLAVALVATGLIGVPGTAFLMLVQGRVQRAAPDRLLGRASAAFSTVDLTATVAGALLAGRFASLAGVRPVVAAALVAVLAAAAVAVTAVPATRPRRVTSR